MSVSIIACPTCKTLLLSDTVQCPACQHVLDSERAVALPGGLLPSQSKAPTVEDPCRNCGELVRRGLVRCWNCGAFMRRDIAASFRRMRDNPTRVIYSDAPAESGGQQPTSIEDAASDKELSVAEFDSVVTDDEDFELAANVEAIEDDFELDGAVAVPPRPQANPASSSAEIPVADTATPESSVDPSTAAAGAKLEQATGDSSETPPNQEAEETTGDQSSESESSPDGSAEAEDSVAHSVATGGDVLLQVALDEEAETEERRAGEGRRGKRDIGPSSPDGVIVFCPNGHRIEVRERHRGKAGRCPKCKELFSVPEKSWEEIRAEQAKAEQEAAESSELAEAAVEQGPVWMHDVHVHKLEPEKLKLKPGSLQNAFEPADMGFVPDGLLMVQLLKKGGMARGADKKKAPIREAILNHLQDGKPLTELPAFEHQLFEPEALRELRVVQPSANEQESMFAGIAVFGTGRIAVRLPKSDDQPNPRFASFALSEFREFARVLADRFSIKRLGKGDEIPLTDEFTDATCHYSEQHFRVLQHIEFYEADPNLEPKLAGWRCQGCQLVVSEDSRKKEKIGGKNARGIAKAACPKCKAKFGHNPLYTLETAEVESESAEPDSAESQVAEPQSTDPASSESATAESTSDESTSTEENTVAESTPTAEATE